MKYFEKIPQFNYSTTIGDFRISYPYSYYEFDYDSVRTQDYSSDNKNTLLEAAAMVYGDPNSFWVFLLSNKTINPFTLLAKNVDIFQKNNEDKLSLELIGNDVIAVNSSLKAQSIIVGSEANTSADPSSFASTGGFDLDGNFALVESKNTYNKKIKIKPVKKVKEYGWNITASSIDGDISAFNYDKIQGYEKSPETYSTANKLPYSVEQTFSEIKESSELFQARVSEIKSSIVDISSTDFSEKEKVISGNKNIKAFLPNELNKVISSLTIIKYTQI